MELEDATLVVERVQHEADVVVHDEGADGVAVHQVGAELLRFGVVAAEDEMFFGRINCLTAF